MSKFAFVLVIVAVAVSVQGFPTFQDDVAAAASSGNWDKVHEILRRNFANIGAGSWSPSGDVRSLKQPSGGHVYAESEATFARSSNVNGQYSQESGGHKVVNNDGHVQEWDIKPQI